MASRRPIVNDFANAWALSGGKEECSSAGAHDALYTPAFRSSALSFSTLNDPPEAEQTPAVRVSHTRSRRGAQLTADLLTQLNQLPNSELGALDPPDNRPFSLVLDSPVHHAREILDSGERDTDILATFHAKDPAFVEVDRGMHRGEVFG
jgi:hypothetical protein